MPPVEGIVEPLLKEMEETDGLVYTIVLVEGLLAWPPTVTTQCNPTPIPTTELHCTLMFAEVTEHASAVYFEVLLDGPYDA